ncbi:unnamed protein product [Adineta steineri]|uniref:Uncharacterized protein n=1 Tax=Adineta steineri TaxID=433720 RepID=A0A814I240_9BILA|nr:unnamed protein product [Adineta steineri]CAF1215187.1 unnamed protein product [Adineta steineri]
MDTTVDTDGTAFICPECNFNGKSLPELISHLDEAHSEETASRSEAPPKNLSSTVQPEKRSRRKPAFSHQIISQASRPSPVIFNQQIQSSIESDSNELWNRISPSDRNEPSIFHSHITDDSSISIISDENTNININSKHLPNSMCVTKRNPNVLHSILSQQRPIAPKNGSPTSTKITPISSPTTDNNSFYSPIHSSIQPYRKNFQCRMCHLTYKNFHDCTAHIRKKHEISHAQAGRYVEKLDTDATLPPSATGNYKFRVKGKSLPPQQINFPSTIKRTSLTSNMNNVYQCNYCSFTSNYPHEINKHQRIIHPNYPPHIFPQEYLNEDNEINNNNNSYNDDDDNNDDEEEGISTLLIDPIRAFGEVIDTIENDNECRDEEILIEHDIDDDEEDALWKYQQEINDLSESDMFTNNNHSNYSLSKSFKKFRCPHCEHSAPTLTKLKLHVATHINIKPFMCSICGWRANLRWYIQCHARKRHSNMNFEVLQLSHEEAEQTINAYMKERGLDIKLNGNQESKRYYQCSSCQFRATHPKFLEQHITINHPNKSYTKMIPNNKKHQINKLNSLIQQTNGHTIKSTHINEQHNDDKLYSKFMIKSSIKKSNGGGDYHHDDKQSSSSSSQALYNRSSLIQSDGTVILPDPSQIVYPNFSTHANFNSNRLFYCALCYRGYRWRYDVKRHHKTMHETPEDEAAMGLSMSPKSIKRRNKEFNRNFRYLEYVPQLDGLIPASMSSVNNNHISSFKHENGLDDEHTFEEHITDDDESQDDDIKLSIADARTVDITEDEAAALLMIEPQKSDQSSILVTDHVDDSIIIFEDDRLKTNEICKTSNRTSTGFKPYRCPYCFYRTNWRTDSLRHIRARHKIEPTQDGYYEMTSDDAENTYAEYERTFGFVVSKKVLGRFTDFRHIEWQDLQKSIWEKIKDKQGYEQIIYDRLRPDNYSDVSKNMSPAPLQTIVTTPTLNKTPSSLSVIKPKRMFTCMECAFRSHKLVELDKHNCTQIQKFKNEKPHGKCLITLYECTKCSYRTIYKNYARKHIYLHRFKNNNNLKIFYYCSFCGYNHQQRNIITVHIAKHHPMINTLTTTISCQYNCDADFTIKQVSLYRSFIERQLTNYQLNKSRVFYCTTCPHVSTSILEHNHHQLCHEENPINIYKCSYCSFASNSLLYTHQHNLLHSKTSRLLSLYTDTKNLKDLSASMIFKETLGKNRRYHCPFCRKFSSSTSSVVLYHIKNIHTGNSNQLNDSLMIGSDMAKEILALGKTVNDDQQMDIS